MKVLIVKNITMEGPGLLKEVLDFYHVPYEIVDLHKEEFFPYPKEYSAVFVLGGPDSANDTTPKMEEELKRINEATNAEIPYLGICLGMQTLVKAKGGKVYKNNVKEVGWKDSKGEYFEVELTYEGKSDPLFAGLISPLKIFHLHGETVRLTDRMTLLATGKYCKNQVVKIGRNAYGIQGHFELTPSMFNEWVTKDPDLILLNRRTLNKDYAKIKNVYETNGKMIIRNFLKIAKLMN